MLNNHLIVLLYLSPVQCWLLQIFETEDGSTSTVTLTNGQSGPPIPDRTRCVQLTLPDHSQAPNSYGSCSTTWDWSNCTADFSGSSKASNPCSSALTWIVCRRNNGYFNLCGRKTCSDPRDGNWGGWSSEACNVASCGSGKVVRIRKCDSPAPMIGGLPCSISGTDTESETIRACEIDCKGGQHLVTNSGLGEWDIWEHCPNVYQATQFQIKSSPRRGVTGIKLACNDPSAKEITSHFWHGDSFPKEFLTCPKGFNKIRTRGQIDGGRFQDDNGLTCFELFCPSSGTWLTPQCLDSNISPLETKTTDCPNGQVVCGIQTRFYYHWSDDLGITDVNIECCLLP